MKWLAWSILFLLVAQTPVGAGGMSHPSKAKALLVFREDMVVHKMFVNRLKAGLHGETKFGVSFKAVLPEELYRPEGEGVAVDLVIAIGDVALQYALLRVEYRRGIYLLISNPGLKARADATGRWTGTMLWVPLNIQLAVLHNTFPQLKKVGTMVTGSSLHLIEEELRQAPCEASLRLKVETLDGPDELLERAADLFKDVDAFIFYPDPVVFNSATIEEVLKLQKELNVPVIAPARAMARLGAYVSIAYDLDALLEELRRHLTGETHLDFEKRCCIEVSINQKVGEMLQLPWKINGEGIEWTVRHLGD